MSDQEMRIAIAEACGKLTDHTREALDRFKDRDGYPDVILQLAKVPDYLNDLNAMHEAEKVLTEYQRIVYLEHLTPKLTPIKDRDWTAFHATAHQRAEAFLRTIGKWRNG